MLRNLPAQEDGFLFLAVRQRPEIAHAPFADHVARKVRGALDIVAGAGSDMPEEDFFGAAAAHEDSEHGFQIFARVGVLIVFRQLHGKPEGHAARNDGHFVNRVRSGSLRGDERVAGFVIRGVLLFLVGKNHGLALDAHEDFVLGHFKIGHGDELATLTRRPESGFVDEVREVGAGEAGSAARDDGKIHVVADRHLARVHAENFFAAFHVGTRHDHAAVEAAGAQ